MGWLQGITTVSANALNVRTIEATVDKVRANTVYIVVIDYCHDFGLAPQHKINSLLGTHQRFGSWTKTVPYLLGCQYQHSQALPN